LEAYVTGNEKQYIPTLKKALANGCWEAAYFDLRKSHAKSPSFYIFAAQILREEASKVTSGDARVSLGGQAVRVLTNCLELGIQDVQMFRTVGYGLLAGGMPERALAVFQRVLDLEASEPQSHLDLALVRFYCLASGDLLSDTSSHLKAAAMSLGTVLRTRWAERFREVEWPALILLRGLRSLGIERNLGDCWPLDDSMARLPSKIEEECREALKPGKPIGLMVWMAWDTDKTDVDLHIVEPSGNEVYYSNNRSVIGGYLSRDFTEGYGPEVYVLQSPVNGSYRVRAKFYASHQASASTGTTSVVIWSFVNLGGAPGMQQAHFSTIRLDTNKQLQDVLQIDIAAGTKARFTAL
jgi:hypothetical protein